MKTLRRFISWMVLCFAPLAFAMPIMRPHLPEAKSLFTPVVLNGEPAKAADPLRLSVVAIEVDLADGTRQCTGFVISPRHVLSVAQCFFPVGQVSDQAPASNVRVRFSDPKISNEVLQPQAIKVHPGYLKAPTVDTGWVRTTIRVSPYDLALLSFPAGFSGSVKPFPVDGEGLQVPTDHRVEIYGMRGQDLVKGEMLVEQQEVGEKLATLKVDTAKSQILESSDMGGPAITYRSDGRPVVWGLLAGQNTGFRGTVSGVSLIQLQGNIYWLMNQIVPDLSAWLTQSFEVKTQIVAPNCRPKKKAPEPARKKIPVPERRPRKPSSVAAGAAALRAVIPPSQNPLIHQVVIMGKEVDDQSPLLKSVVSISTGSSSCSGTLVSPIHVLTAAHCFDENNVKYPRGVRARFYRNSRDIVLEIPAVRIRPHHSYKEYPKNDQGNLDTQNPQYRLSSWTDIALITLERPAPAPFEAMAMLPYEMKIQSRDKVHVAGTGRDSLTDKSSMHKLKFTTMNISDSGRTNAWIVVPDGNGGAMPGDSGGSALHFDRNGRPYLWGVIIQTSIDETLSRIYSSRVLPIFNQSGWLYEMVQKDMFEIQDGILKPVTETVRTPIRDCP